jgi:hypothetical protein
VDGPVHAPTPARRRGAAAVGHTFRFVIVSTTDAPRPHRASPPGRRLRGHAARDDRPSPASPAPTPSMPVTSKRSRPTIVRRPPCGRAPLLELDL